MGAPRRRLTLFAISSIFWRLIRQNTSKYVKICQFSFFRGSEKTRRDNMSIFVFWVGCLRMGNIFRSCGICANNWQSLQTFRTYQILTLQIRMLNFLCCFLFWDQILAAPPGPGMMPGPKPDSRRALSQSNHYHCLPHIANTIHH